MATASTETRIGLINPLVPTNERSATSSKGSSESPEGWERIVDELLRIRTLQDDWDGQGATAPLAANVDAALNWINQMRFWDQAICPNKAVAGVDAEVHLVWQTQAVYLDAEIANPNSVNWLVSIKGQSTRQWTTDFAQTWLVGALE